MGAGPDETTAGYEVPEHDQPGPANDASGAGTPLHLDGEDEDPIAGGSKDEEVEKGAKKGLKALPVSSWTASTIMAVEDAAPLRVVSRPLLRYACRSLHSASVYLTSFLCAGRCSDRCSDGSRCSNTL